MKLSFSQENHHYSVSKTSTISNWYFRFWFHSMKLLFAIKSQSSVFLFAIKSQWLTESYEYNIRLTDLRMCIKTSEMRDVRRDLIAERRAYIKIKCQLVRIYPTLQWRSSEGLLFSPVCLFSSSSPHHKFKNWSRFCEIWSSLLTFRQRKYRTLPKIGVIFTDLSEAILSKFPALWHSLTFTSLRLRYIRSFQSRATPEEYHYTRTKRTNLVIWWFVYIFF